MIVLLQRRSLKTALAVGCGLLLALVLSGRLHPTGLSGRVEMAEMTWIDVRAAIREGYRTVIVPSGGFEQNGRHMVLSKHDHIVRYAARAIAERLGGTLVAPVVSFVPEGDFDPPSGNQAYPGTIGVPPAVFEGVLEGIAASLKLAGFKTICLIADHGQSLAPQSAVAARLSARWAAEGVEVIDVGRYYADAEQVRVLLAEGESRETIGSHAGIQDTSELLAVHPNGVSLPAMGLLDRHDGSDGSSGEPSRASAERGRKLLDIKITAAVEQIRRARKMDSKQP